MSTPLDELRQLAAGTLPPPPIAALIGFTPITVSPGEAVVELAAGRQHANPMGTLHGGVLCDIADEQQTLVARASSTCMTLRGEQAHGR